MDVTDYLRKAEGHREAEQAARNRGDTEQAAREFAAVIFSRRAANALRLAARWSSEWAIRQAETEEQAYRYIADGLNR